MTPLHTPYIEPLEICERCKTGVSYVFDFNRRCCRARHLSILPLFMRVAEYQVLAEREGPASVVQIRDDVKAVLRPILEQLANDKEQTRQAADGDGDFRRRQQPPHQVAGKDRPFHHGERH